VHVASTGGVWSTLVSGFGGFRDHNGVFAFDPRLPDAWSKLTFRITLHGTRVRATLEPESISFAVEVGDQARLLVRGAEVVVTADSPVTVPLEGQGPRLYGAPTMRDVTGSRRADGTLLTASIPTLSLDVDEEESPLPID
jgi:alpha,alpha-trehalose phosphorylase